MARPRKEGRKAKGVYSKSGMLYIVVSKTIIKNGNKKYINDWIPTNLNDSAENIKKAIDVRNAILSDKNPSIDDKNITFESFLKIYLNDKKRTLADTTYAGYMYKCNHILEYFRNVKVKDINEEYIQDFLDLLFTGKNLGTRTVQDVKRVFYNIMEYGITKRIISINPVKNVTINKQLSDEHLSSKDEDEVFFSYEEAMHFLEISRNHQLYPLFHTTLIYGLRRSEALGLKWDAIDFEKKIIKIRHKVTRGTKINRIDGTKTEASRQSYPLDSTQIEMFRKLKEKEQQYRELFGSAYNDNDYIFKHEDGTLFYPDYPSKAFTKLKKRHKELPQDVTFHGLRKSCASILIHKGYDIKRIQKWMRHTDPDTTIRIYAKAKEKESKTEIAADMIDSIPVDLSVFDDEDTTGINSKSEDGNTNDNKRTDDSQ